MSAIRLYVGTPPGLRPFLAASVSARAYALTPAARLFAIPVTDDVQDDIHRVWGTGTWLETGPRIASGDMTFAARASKEAPVGYLERVALDDGAIEDSAVLWTGGALRLGPLTMLRGAGRPARARSLWPINVVLRGLGQTAEGRPDEAEAFGLVEHYASEADLVAKAAAVRL